MKPSLNAPVIDEAAYRAAKTAKEKLAILKPLFVWAQKQTDVPWEIQAAQFGLESGWGSAVPIDISSGKYSYNLFGVKGTGTAGFVMDWGYEYDENGKRYDEVMKWRAYNSFAESILDHAEVLANDYWQPVHEQCGLDVACWAVQLSPAGRGYATDPYYESSILDVVDTIRGWGL